MSFHGKVQRTQQKWASPIVRGEEQSLLLTGLDRKWGLFFFNLPCFFCGGGEGLAVQYRGAREEGRNATLSGLGFSPFPPLFFKKSDSSIVFCP